MRAGMPADPRCEMASAMQATAPAGAIAANNYAGTAEEEKSGAYCRSTPSAATPAIATSPTAIITYVIASGPPATITTARLLRIALYHLPLLHALPGLHHAAATLRATAAYFAAAAARCTAAHHFTAATLPAAAHFSAATLSAATTASSRRFFCCRRLRGCWRRAAALRFILCVN